MRYGPYAVAARLDRRLGNPEDGGRLFSYARCAALDEREEFPLEICRELDFLGLPWQYVPVEYGGRLRGYDEALQLMRAVARRDLTVAIGHGKTFLGAVSVWVGGSTEQARRLGAAIMEGSVISWALTERDHGSDLLAGEVRAVHDGGSAADGSGDRNGAAGGPADNPADGESTATSPSGGMTDGDGPADDGNVGYRLSGEKWLINNATRGHQLCVLARTDQAGGPRGFSVLLIDRRTLNPASHRPLPAPLLHGIRGADISGIAFTDAAVPSSALVGAEGGGLEIVLKSLQLTRTLCASLSLGAADQAMEMAVRYAHERHNFGRPLVELPQTRRLLTESYADLLLAEAVSLVAARAIHTLPGELSVGSAATKYLVPTVVEQLLARLARVLGSRSLLADGTYRHGRFQKVQRDHRIVGIFDGSTVVNLHALVNQFPSLVRAHRRGRVDLAGLHGATDLGTSLPAFDRERLQLVSLNGSSLIQSLPDAIPEVPLGDLGERLRTTVDEVTGLMAEHRPTALDVPTEAFALAERYAWCFAAAAAVHLWSRNHKSLQGTEVEELWDSGLWLKAGITRALARIDPTVRPDGEVYDRLARPLLAQHRSGRPLSLLPHPLEDDAV
ncbi:acyl-CoA dehydrogenase family protein [Streptomyces sp. NBC_00988]|uniref:acyl-CoA dehydrogenase family protein n=1 Tax=Streptomyces sp. NBC_00988 TaxID=2903704 RepID=UPI003863281C|nr:acyl-CoA dehydrogenase family protein [Streptomyces sp. NBC_00988]